MQVPDVQNLLGACGWQAPRDVNADAFVDWRQGTEGLTPKTLNDYLASIKGLLNWMERQGRIERNPLEKVGRVDTRGKASFERRAYTVAELQQLFNVSHRRSVVYLTAVTTGLRRNELRQLRWDDVHLDCEYPRIQLRAATTKNRRADPLPLTEELAAALRGLRNCKQNGGALVFRGILPRREIVKKDLERAGISIFDDLGRKVDFHALRMTFNTLLAEADVPERVRQELMRQRRGLKPRGLGASSPQEKGTRQRVDDRKLGFPPPSAATIPLCFWGNVWDVLDFGKEGKDRRGGTFRLPTTKGEWLTFLVRQYRTNAKQIKSVELDGPGVIKMTFVGDDDDE